MEVLRKKIYIGKDGKIKLDVNTHLTECDAEIVLVVDKTEISESKKYDLSRFSGTLKTFDEDPVAYQKRLRDEWK